MKHTTCLSLGALLLLGCGKKDEAAEPAKGESVAAPSAKATAAPTVPKSPEPEAPKGLAVAAGLSCEDVVDHRMTAFPGDPDAAEEQKTSMLERCEGEWTAAMRECVKAGESKHAPLTCATTVREAECKAVVSRLSALAAHESKVDASLGAKEASLSTACADLKAESRKCLIEATTLGSFSECQGVQPVAEVAASAALGWKLGGVASWAWPAYFKGSAAERLSAEAIVLGGDYVRPSLRIQCSAGALQVRVWGQTTLGAEGGKKALTVAVRLDGADAVEHKVALEMGEHLVFQDSELFASSLASASTMALSLHKSAVGPMKLQFDVQGTAEVLAKLGSCEES